MADSDSEIEFNRRHNDTEMEEDQPGADIEELDQLQEHDIHDRAASVLSSIDHYLKSKTTLHNSQDQDLLWRAST